MSKIPIKSGQPASNEIDASPTKDLFISMLIRDLSIEDAIGDLVDNCVDGAKSLSTDKNYRGLWVKVHANKNEFRISDNCGGIDIETARNYAFKFGRDKKFHAVKFSIGNFGIGMKRALFKLGGHFEIDSTWKNSFFKIKVNVDEWRNEPEWKFEFLEQKKVIKNNPKDKVGTNIIVTELNDDVSAQFDNTSFIDKLKKEIELENLYNIHNGLTIEINEEKLKARQLDFLSSDEFKIGYYTEKFFEEQVSVKIYAGVSNDELDEGGWYIFCNDRLILGPDQTALTGWGDGAAKYHGQYQRFRGLVFFESDNADLLPWNTTKNGLDKSSGIYQRVKLKMIEMMKVVLSFLNKLKEERENDNPKSNWILANKLSVAKPVRIAELKENDTAATFTFPSTPSARTTPGNNIATISYKRPKTEVEKVKKYLGLSSNGEVGEYTFEYFINMEME